MAYLSVDGEMKVLSGNGNGEDKSFEASWTTWQLKTLEKAHWR